MYVCMYVYVYIYIYICENVYVCVIRFLYVMNIRTTDIDAVCELAVTCKPMHTSSGTGPAHCRTEGQPCLNSICVD